MSKKLIISQSDQSVEQVNSGVIDKLYQLVSTAGALTNDSDVEGNINSPVAYEDAVAALRTRFPNLVISANAYYIRFADPNVLSVLVNAGFGDGTGITTSEAATANISNTFQNNTDIVSFDEFKYFTAQQGRATSFFQCTSLERIDISDCANIGNHMFDGCTNLEYFHGANSVRGALIIPNGISSIVQFAFRSCLGITTLTLHGNITIGSGAFENCSNLNAIYTDSLADWLSITFNDQPLRYAHNLYINGSLVQNVTIPSDTDLTNKFYGSTSLESVVIESGITSIGSNAFTRCTALTSISLPSSLTTIGQFSFYSCGFMSLTLPSSVTTIGRQAFWACPNLTSIDIPTSITSIGESAFYSCTNLVISDLNIPKLTSLGNSAFQGTKIQQISNLGSITSIPGNCFFGCSVLTSVVLPNTVTSIGNSAFSGCTALTGINIPSGVTSIGSSAFAGCTALTSISIPSGVTSIGEKAFSGCRALTSVTIPTNAAKDKAQIFSGCAGLTTATFGSGTTHTGRGTFLGCTALQTINGLDDLVVVQSGAFQGCTSLTSVVLPSSLTQIDQDAFLHCSGLQSVTINAVTPPTLGSTNAFNNTNNCPIYVPAGSVSAYQSASGWSTYASRIQAIPTT